MTEQILPITGLKVGEVSEAVLVCGDPARAEKTAAHLQNAHLIADKREYRAFKGTYKNQEVVVCSHGVGSAGAAIAFEELISAGPNKSSASVPAGEFSPPSQMVISS